MHEQLRDRILSYFQQNPRASKNSRTLAKLMQLNDKEEHRLGKILDQLVREGHIETLPKGQFRLAKQKMVEGVVRRNVKGFGWLEVGESREDSLFIAPPSLRELMDGDVVLARVEQQPKGPVADIQKIVKRARREVTGTAAARRGRLWLEASDNSYEPILIAGDKRATDQEVIDGAIYELQIDEYQKGTRPAAGSIIRYIGKEDSISTLIAMKLIGKGVISEFSEKTLKEIEPFKADPSAADRKGRKDITDIPLCTIDGETAKDFDDAVYAQKKEGGYRVVVAIADVSHYVKPGTSLDADAFERATSIYYPGKCIPMLPEVLSNGLCSLKPEVPRLCMVCEFTVSRDGKVKNTKLYEGVMRSVARLTYNQVQEFLDKKVGKAPALSDELATSLEHLREAALALRGARQKRGAIDFDIVESFVALNDEGEPVHIRPSSRLEAHRIIEDLMVATNEAVAVHLEEKNRPTVFRIHEPPSPEKLEQFLTLAQSVGAITPADRKAVEADPSPKHLSALLKKLEGHSAKTALDSLLLRSMMQAKYSSHNLGHYGLASQSYLHFTSPIRRYPDLLVHRHVRELLKQKGKALSEDEIESRTDELERLALHCSDRERKATELEREIAQLHAVWLMSSEVGFEDDGVITSVAEFGLFVRLTKHYVEGMLHVSTIGKEHVQFDPLRLRLVTKSGFSYNIGDPVRVRVANVNLRKGFIDLELVQDQGKNVQTSSRRDVQRNPKRDQSRRKRR